MTPKKEKALAALLVHPTKEAAAAAAGIDSKTLRRYLQDPEFQEAYKKAFSDLVGDATRQAQQKHLLVAIPSLTRMTSPYPRTVRWAPRQWALTPIPIS